MNREHHYRTHLIWTGNSGSGTSGYTEYERSYEISAEGKGVIAGSSDPAFRGDRTRWSPEELLVASLSACHELWYLHLCAEAGIIVVKYLDDAEGVMDESVDGGGRFQRVTLRPQVTVTADADQQRAHELHEAAHSKCFIANSINFTVCCCPTVMIEKPVQTLK